MSASLVGSEMCIRDRTSTAHLCQLSAKPGSDGVTPVNLKPPQREARESTAWRQFRAKWGDTS
eukprot:193592-Alexandrium_andersonii.AAC.1